MNEKAREAARDEIAHWPLGHGFYGTTIGINDAAEIADAVLAVVEPILQAQVAAAAAKAWDEGMRTGTSRAMRYMSDEPHLPVASAEDNPYLTEARR